MKKYAWLSAIALVLLLAYTAAGPFLTIHAIRTAVQADDSRALSRQVDFPALRSSLRLQLNDAMVREVGPDLQSSLLGAIGLRLAGSAVGTGVDMMVTPVGLSALMRGRRVWSLAGGAPLSTADEAATRTDPLEDAHFRYHSPSRFTATVRDDRDRPIVFVLTRSGIQWKLSDIRLPV
ncbi:MULTISPECIES: DUF2939 domain-containing protein [Luteimonas]|uniref:DUF2939 domain-containing protein n=1 Tax=Luteimonas TaxID=83614 RepID=UPI000C797261|nr:MULTISPECIES: DUF2939 domain-containing protein [Luteimonas]